MATVTFTPSVRQIYHDTLYIQSEDTYDQIMGITIFATLPLEADITGISDISCYGYSDGSATVTLALGVPPYHFWWDDDQNTTEPTVMGLSADHTYHATVTDANNCSTQVSVDLSQPPQLQIAAVVINPSSYLWTINGGNIISGQGTNSITVHRGATGSGFISVLETDEYGCEGDTIELAITIGATGIDNASGQKMMYTPIELNYTEENYHRVFICWN